MKIDATSFSHSGWFSFPRSMPIKTTSFWAKCVQGIRFARYTREREFGFNAIPVILRFERPQKRERELQFIQRPFLLVGRKNFTSTFEIHYGFNYSRGTRSMSVYDLKSIRSILVTWELIEVFEWEIIIRYDGNRFCFCRYLFYEFEWNWKISMNQIMMRENLCLKCRWGLWIITSGEEQIFFSLSR